MAKALTIHQPGSYNAVGYNFQQNFNRSVDASQEI